LGASEVFAGVAANPSRGVVDCEEDMMAAVMVPVSDAPVEVDAPAAVREQLEDFGAEVLEEAVNRPAQ
jgi:hypothetical protein